jgi:hypothetical protein
MDDEQAGRADPSVDRLIEFVQSQGEAVAPWQEQFMRTIFGIPVIESAYAPEGEMYLLGGRTALVIRTATPVVPYGQWMCEKGSHGSLRLGACPFCGAQT